MPELLLCRVCLASGVTVYNILNSGLQEMYEKLTRLPLHADDGKPHTVCCMCLRLLRSSYNLWVKSVTADRLLTLLFARGNQLTQDSINLINRHEHKLAATLTIVTEHLVDIDPTETVKNEVLVKDEREELKLELQGCVSDAETHVSSKPGVQTDSEDDIPLLAISKRKKLDNAHEDGKNNKKKDKEFLKGFKSGYAQELILTKEQQLQELRDRAASINYLNAPFKCEMCCRGYIDTNAFENHMDKHDEKSGTHVCDICKMRYKTARKLRAHAVTAHERRYKCTSCSQITHTASQAREHERRHRGLTYACRVCGHESRAASSHLTHARTRHRARHTCAACGAGFVGAHGLRMHCSKAHARPAVSDDSPAADRHCADCDVQFLTMLAFKRHLLSSVNHAFIKNTDGVCVICGPSCPGGGGHLRESVRALMPSSKVPSLKAAVLTCEQCGASFASGSKLQAHVRRVHLGVKYNKNVVCEVCGKTCTSRAALTYHQRTHTGERPYACTACPARFADANQRRIHARAHSGERPYRCRSCHRAFAQRPALTRHYRVHTGAKPYACQYCAKCFSQSNSMKLHVRTVHLKLPANKRRARNDKKEEKTVE